MKIVLRRLKGEKLAIEPVVKHSRPEPSTKETTKSLTMLDIIGLGLLTALPLALLASMPTLLDNLPTKENESDD